MCRHTSEWRVSQTVRRSLAGIAGTGGQPQRWETHLHTNGSPALVRPLHRVIDGESGQSA